MNSTTAPLGTEPPTTEDGAKRRRGFSMPSLNSVSLLMIWAAVIVLFGITQPDTFLTSRTAKTIASDEAITAMMALSLVLPLAAGVFDLSIGGIMGISVVLVAWFQAEAGIAPELAIPLTLLCALLIGSVNAFVVVKLKVDSFIATLGMSSILLAGVQWVSGGQQIVSGIPSSFTDLGRTQLLGIPMPFYYMLVLAAILWYITSYRQTGRYLYATGSNPEAARLAGLRTEKLKAISLMVSGLIAGLAGIIFTAKIGSASLEAGPPYLLPAFAAVFLGATQFRSRHVNVLGTLIAVYVLATGVKGLQLSGAPFWVEDLFNGLALIVAVAFAVRASRKRA